MIPRFYGHFAASVGTVWLVIVTLGSVSRIALGIWQLVWILVACAFYAAMQLRAPRPTRAQRFRRVLGPFLAALGTSMGILTAIAFLTWPQFSFGGLGGIVVILACAIYAAFRYRSQGL